MSSSFVNISKLIGELSSISNITINDNSTNIDQAAKGMNEISGNINTVKLSIDEIVSEITAVTEGNTSVDNKSKNVLIQAGKTGENVQETYDTANHMNSLSKEVSTSSTVLTDVASELNKSVNQFKI